MVPPEKKEPGSTPTGGEKRNLSEGSICPSKRQATGNCDDDVVVFTPAKVQVEVVDLLSDSPQAVHGNTTNPNILFPHARALCGVYKLKESPESFCEKCYCVICDIPAKDCDDWGQHCRATIKPTKPKTVAPNEPINVEHVDLTEEAQLPLLLYRQFPARRRLRPLEPSNDDDDGVGGRERSSRYEKPDFEKPITEILAQKLARAINLSGNGKDQEGDDSREHRFSDLKMDGDIGELKLQSSFFVEGVKIGWPFPEILPPQRQMAIHIIRALKRKLHVVLESPTGTGKSAAILCSVLAWQRYQAHMQKRTTKGGGEGASRLDAMGGDKKNETVPKIIYCSRTHSQVAQMVESLKKTPYRPRMTVLGSRERLCINT